MNNMKKILMVLMIAFTMVGVLFAYEPKKECFEVITDLVTYKEEVKVEADVLLWDYLLDDNRCFTRHFFLELGELEYEAEKNYLKLLESRTSVELHKKQKNLYKRYKKDSLVKLAEEFIEKEINEAVYEIPFVTRENFYKISKRKYMKMFINYMESLKK